MYLSKIKKIVIGVSLALPMTTYGAGLGPLNVTSGIGEPLKADIQLLSLSAAEKATLKARIAPASSYSAQGLERPASHNDIRVNVTKSPAGKNILTLRSIQPVTEPFLDMLIELEWGTGRILREYTVLLDPPGYDGSVNTVSTVEKPSIKQVDKSKIAAINNKRVSKSSSQAGSASTTNANQNAPVDDYLTRRGDTLSKIARRMKPAGVSLEQMLVGLYEANPEAFDGKNMNRLKVGKILQPPTQEALNAMSRKQAVKEVKVQAANWNQYRNKLAGVVADSAPGASVEDTQVASGKIKSSAEDKSIPASNTPKDVVKLSSGDAKAQADMEAKITALQEEVSAREKGLQEALDRTAALEKQIEDMQKLLTLRNDALAAAQQPDTKAAAKQEQVSAPSVVEPAEPVSAPPKAVAPAKPVAPTKPVANPTPTTVEEPGFIDGLLETVSGMLSGLNAALMAAGALVIALLAGAWFYLRNKRRRNLADFEQGIMTSGGLKANTVFGNTSGASVDTGDTSFLTDFSQSTTGSMIDTNDVDPIAEAEVYMAYGRDAQAEEILKDAISKEPKRYELHLKLLEMYAASKNMSAFEAVSGELYTTLGAEDPTWSKVAEIGIKLEPNNPLYQAKGAVGATAAAVTGAAATVAATTSADSSPDESADKDLDASDFSDSPLAAEADLDFSLNEDAQNEAEVATDEAAPLEMGVDALNDADESVLEIPNVSEVLETDDSALEFGLDAPVDQAEETIDESENFTDTMPALDFPSMDNAEADVEPSPSLDEAAPSLEGAAPSLEGATEVPELEMPSDLTLDMPEIEEAGSVGTMEITDDAASESVEFDMSTLTADTVTLEADSDSAVTADDDVPVLDMSDISLDINDDVNDAIAEAEQGAEAAADPVSDSPESEEVETKLELVAAYIDMEDKEGAKELLDEVINEGGPNQRKRAEDLLATLG